MVDAVAESTTAQVSEVQQPADEDVDMTEADPGSKSEDQAKTHNNEGTSVTEAATSAPSENKPATGVKLEELFDEMDSDEDDEFPTTKAAAVKREAASSPDLIDR